MSDNKFGFLFAWAKEEGVEIPTKSDKSADIGKLYLMYLDKDKKTSKSTKKKKESIKLPKRPNRADYLKEYGWKGEMMYRLDLIKYEEEVAAIKRKKDNDRKAADLIRKYDDE